MDDAISAGSAPTEVRWTGGQAISQPKSLLSSLGVTPSGLLLFVVGVSLAMTYFLNARMGATVAITVVLAVAPLYAVLRFDRRGSDWRAGNGTIIGGAVLLSALLAYGAAAVWPNSGDEYGYLYLADTLLHGRFYNPLPPVQGLFDFFWIGMHDGKSASQYPPGWPVVLAAFRAVHLHRLANPVLVGVLGLLLSGCLKRLGVVSQIRLPLLALILLSPYTIFNGASLFSHLLAAVATVGVCYLQLYDEQTPAFWKKAGIGAFMSLLLVTRHDSFALLAGLFAVDRLIIRRLEILKDVPAFILGGIPITAAWLRYNLAITGSPFLTTMRWAFPGFQTLGIVHYHFAVANTVNMAALLFLFAGAVPILLYGWALHAKLRRRTVRFYDLLLPAAFLLFIFYPHSPGHQYGPRYWYFAWPCAALTIGPELTAAGGAIAIAGRHFGLAELTRKQLYLFAGFTIGFAVFLRMYVDERRAIYTVQVPQIPAIVLVPDRHFVLVPWQIRPFLVADMDMTRNGLDYDGKILYGRAEFAGAACAMTGYHLFAWRGPGPLEPVKCPG